MWAIGNEPNARLQAEQLDSFFKLTERLSAIRDDECRQGRNSTCWHPITVPLAGAARTAVLDRN